MPLSVGDKLGPYEILALVGNGGTGEVYRAHDSRLNRDVAIKVSHAQFTERFTREARAVAALNHPNICTLYDVGPNYLIMEYIEGESPKGPLPLEEAGSTWWEDSPCAPSSPPSKAAQAQIKAALASKTQRDGLQLSGAASCLRPA